MYVRHKFRFVNDGGITLDVILPIIVNLVNTLIAIALVRYIIQRDTETFNKIYFGSVLIRMLFMFIFVWFGLTVLKLNVKVFPIATVVSYFIFKMTEIIYVNSIAEKLNKANKQIK